jgi:glycosyltransferase involved in cell wall biosynthesis
MHHIRWFAPNRYCALPVQRLRDAGLSIATEGDAPARLTFLSDAELLREAFRFARRHRAPMIANIWDVQPWQVEGGRPDYVVPVGGALAVLPRLGRRYPGRPRYYSRVRFLVRNAREVWAPSHFSQSEIGRWSGRVPEHMPYCYDSDRFNAAAGWRRPAGRPVVISISRLAPHKNHAALVRAATLLPSQARVRIIGRGSEASDLRTLAARLGVELQLDERWLTNEEIVEAYRRASVVVCPSRFEGIGVTPLEGIAMGIPTIATDIPPHREFAGARATLVPLDDADAMARAITAALSHPDATPTHGAPSELTIDACATRMLGAFEALLRDRTALPFLDSNQNLTAPKAGVLPLHQRAVEHRKGKRET